MLLDFGRAPEWRQLEELQRRGAPAVGYVPETGVVVAAEERASFEGLNVSSARTLRVKDKLSPELAGVPDAGGALAGDVETPAASLVVEFHPDVDMNEARAVVRENGIAVRERLGLLPHQLLVEATAAEASALAEWEEVAYIFPASAELADGGPVRACAGALSQYGTVGQAVARIGDGWDGPGAGAAVLGYFLGPLASGLPREAAQGEILRALEEWSRQVKVTFSPVASPAANRTIAILFAAGSHGDPYPFDGHGNVLAHTFYPAPPNPEPIAGDMHFDDAEDWGIDGGIDVFSVALHEAGHALGLGHSDKPGTVMYPYYRKAAALTAEDVAAIRELYAATEPAPPEPKPDDPPAPPEPKPEPRTPDPPQPPDPKPPETPPVIRITSPAGGQPFTSATASVLVAGSAAHADGIARVSWATARAGGTASGTTNWIAGPIPLENGANTITVTALGRNGLSASASVAVTYAPSADTVAPAVTILAPASTTYWTYAEAITVSGEASDSVGVTAVEWADSLGRGGVARGTVYWTAADIALREGINTITIRARDAAGNTGWRSLTVTRKRR